MKEFAALQLRSYNYLTDNNDEDKKIPSHKKVRHKSKNQIWRL